MAIDGIAPDAFGAKSWRESVATSADLPLIDNIDGDARIATDTGTVWVWGGEWRQGASGAQGIQGVQGEKGDRGDTGTDGADGAAATITIHSTTILSPGNPATVANVGTSNAASLDFGIPQGVAGAQGIQGIQGPKGDKGDTGPTGPTGSSGSSSSITSPTDLSGLIIWLNAAAITGLSDGDPVINWPNLGSLGGNFAASSSSRRPLYRINHLNGQAAVVFDGIDDGLSLAGVTISTFSIFVVFRATNASYGIVEHGTSGSANYYYLATTYNNTCAVQRNSFVSSLQIVPRDHNNIAQNWAGDGRWKVLLDSWPGSYTLHRLTVNGSASPFSVLGSDNANLVSSASMTDTLWIGNRHDSNSFIAGEYEDVLIYSPGLAPVDERKVIAWLQQKDAL